MSIKNSKVAILNVLEAAGAQVIADATAAQYSIVKDTTNSEVLLGPIDYGKTVKMDVLNSQAEVRQIVLIGGPVQEVIAADTRYGLKIIENSDLETEALGEKPFAYKTGATISGDADLARADVFNNLVAKVNAYNGVNTSALAVHEIPYTLGGATGNETPAVGDVVTQQTSGVVGVVVNVPAVSSGTFAGGDAAGNIYIATLATPTIAGTLTWTYQGSTLTQADGTTVLSQGIALRDDAGYFTSKINRKGANGVYIHAGFATATAVFALAAVYPMGIGSVMAALKPVYDDSGQDMLRGDAEFDFEDGMLVDAAKTYRKYVITVRDGDEEALPGYKVEGDSQHIIWVSEDNSTNLGTFDTALDAEIVK